MIQVLFQSYHQIPSLLLVVFSYMSSFSCLSIHPSNLSISHPHQKPVVNVWYFRPLSNSLRHSDHFCEFMNSEVNDSVSNSVIEMLRTLKYVEE